MPSLCPCRAPKSLGQGLVEYKRLIPYLLGPVHVSWLPLDLDLLPKPMPMSWAFLKVIHVQRHCLLTYADNAMCTHHSLSPPVWILWRSECNPQNLYIICKLSFPHERVRCSLANALPGKPYLYFFWLRADANRACCIPKWQRVTLLRSCITFEKREALPKNRS